MTEKISYAIFKSFITLLQARRDCIYRQKSKIMWQLITSHFRHAQKKINIAS